MNKIPCIENKCILRPVCKSKTLIVCPDLMEYYRKWRFVDRNASALKIRKHLSNVVAVKDDRNSIFDDYAFIYVRGEI